MLKRTAGGADKQIMAAWLSKVMHALNGQETQRRPVLEALSGAVRGRVKLTVEVASGEQTLVAASTIEHVREDDLIISQPTIGGLTHPLAFGETVKMGFVYESQFHSGESRCLGRIKVPAGDGQSMMYAYRMSIPTMLGTTDRRLQPRTRLELDEAIEAQLYAPSLLDGPLLGRIFDLSMTGVSVAAPLPRRPLAAGSTVYLKAMLPEPVGLIDELVSVARVEIDPITKHGTIGLQFHRRIDGIEQLMRTAAHAA